jgi:hypothetical protein
LVRDLRGFGARKAENAKENQSDKISWAELEFSMVDQNGFWIHRKTVQASQTRRALVD